MTTLPDASVTLANCESEPIHIPGAIQPHGAFISCSAPELTITQVSLNLAEFFDVQPSEALGREIALLLDAESHERLLQISTLRACAR